jgi:hypothetical protein
LVIRPWSGAGEEQGVGVGGAAGGPVRAVVDLIVVAGFWTVRACAAAVAGVADDALIGGGDAVLAAQVEGSFVVVVEHRQVVDAVGAHPDHVTHRQRGVSAGVRRRRHRDIRLVTAWAAWLSSARVVRTITVTGCPRCDPMAPEPMPAFSASLMPSWQRWAGLRSSATSTRVPSGRCRSGRTAAVTAST